MKCTRPDINLLSQTRSLWRAACIAIAAIIFCVAKVDVYAAAPATVQANYDFYRDSMQVATVRERYETHDGRYSVVSDTAPSGMLAALIRARIKVESSGTISATGLQPDQFAYTRLDDASRNITAAFDWPASQLRMHFDNHDETAALQPGIQDRLSVMYQFMFAPAASIEDFTFQMTNGKKTEQYHYKLVGREELDTSLGKFKTLHLAKQRSGDESANEVWLAVDRNMFPVKLLIVESDGSRYEQVITQLDFR